MAQFGFKGYLESGVCVFVFMRVREVDSVLRSSLGLLWLLHRLVSIPW